MDSPQGVILKPLIKIFVTVIGDFIFKIFVTVIGDFNLTRRLLGALFVCIICVVVKWDRGKVRHDDV